MSAPPGAARAFGALFAETLRDAVRRRGLIAAALASLGAALLVQRCGSCETNVVLQGEDLALRSGQLGAIGALLGFGVVALWTYALTALLASDGLMTAIDDGTAESTLARPVSRDVFVAARCVGLWSGCFAIGAALLALVAGLAAARHGLSWAPALHAIGAVGTAALGVAALAMWTSLHLPRVPTLLGLTSLGLAVCGIELAALFGAAGSGWVGAVAHLGPAWLSAPVAALAPWLSDPLPGSPAWPQTRALAWAALFALLLRVRFRRVELLR